MILLATGVVIAVLGLLLLMADLDNADKYASVIGALGTLAGLGLSLSALMRRPSRAASPPGDSGTATGQQIEASDIGGAAIQVQGVGGTVRIGRSPSLPPQGGSPQPPRRATPPPISPGAQAVTNTQTGGSSAQIDQVAGDVEIERDTQ